MPTLSSSSALAMHTGIDGGVIDVVGEVPGQHRGHAPLQEAAVVAAALIGAHVNLEVIAQGIRHDRAGGLGGGHIEVVDKDAAQVMSRRDRRRPKGVWESGRRTKLPSASLRLSS